MNVVQDTLWERMWREALNAPVPGPDDATWGNEIDRRKVRFLQRYTPRDGIAAEIGCGSARLLARVGRTSPALRLVAVDESTGALRLAERTAAAFNVTITTTQGTTLALPFRDETVDLVISGGLLEHFPEPMPVLSEMLRVLRPGGVLYADVVPRKRSWYRAHEAERMRTSEYLDEGVYESAFGPLRLCGKAARAGMRCRARCVVRRLSVGTATLRPFAIISGPRVSDSRWDATRRAVRLVLHSPDYQAGSEASGTINGRSDACRNGTRPDRVRRSASMKTSPPAADHAARVRHAASDR